ncbi:MAG: MBL fold metallo-hydrolase [Fimbriimonadales bacterium]
MNILITGSGGADGIPSFFSDSEVSRYARDHGGKDVRSRAAAIVDNAIKIDFGPDTYAQCSNLGLKASDWKHVLFTHSHFDHYAPGLFQYAFPPFTEESSTTPIMWGNQAILSGFSNAFEDQDKLEKRLLKSFAPVDIDGYRVTPIRAYHKLDEDSLNLIIEKDGKSLLYAVDTGVYQEETWEFLAGRRFDVAVIECADGFLPADYWGHLSCDELVQVVDRLRNMGCLDGSSVVCTTHHAHTGMATHAQLEERLSPDAIEVGFDGKLINF